jgi:hypothetical protein
MPKEIKLLNNPIEEEFRLELSFVVSKLITAQQVVRIKKKIKATQTLTKESIISMNVSKTVSSKKLN